MSSPSPQADGDEAGSPRAFAFNVNLVFIGTIVDYALAFLVAVLLARALGPEGRGVVALYQSAVNLGFAFVSAGLSAAVIFFVARRDITPRQAMEAGLSVTLMATVAALLGVAVAALLFGGLSERDAPFWLAAVALPALVQGGLLGGVLRAQARFAAMKVVDASSAVAALLALGSLEALRGLDVRYSVYAWSLSFLPPVLLGYALVGPDAWPRALAGMALLRRVVAFGVQSQLSNLIQLLNYRLDAYLVLMFVSAGGVGLYAVGVSLSEGMWFIANSVAVVLLTDLTAGDAARARRMTAVVCRNTLLVTALVALAAGAVSPFVIPLLFGPAFEGAVLPFVLLLPGTVALAGAKVLAAYVFSRGKPLINAWVALATLVVTVVADLILIPLAGVEGAAMGSSLAYFASLTLTALAYRSLSGHDVRDALLPRRGDLHMYVDAARSLAGRLGLRSLSSDAEMP